MRLFKKMVNGILQNKRGNGKRHLSKDRNVFGLYLKKETWKYICKLQGWKKGKYTKFAKCLNCTRQYAAGLAQGRFSFDNPTFLANTILLAQGRLDGEWTHLVEFRIKVRDVDPNHPMFNIAKYNGQIPYTEYSLSADFRNKMDYKVETEKR